MSLVTKAITAVFLIAILSGTIMASGVVDFNDPNYIADDAKLGVVRPLVKAVPTHYPNYEITLDANLVDAFEALVNGDRFKGNGIQVKNLLEGLKALYAQLAEAVGGSVHLKEELDEQEIPLVGSFELDLTLPLADYNNPKNKDIIAKLKEALGHDHEGHDANDCDHTVLCVPCGSTLEPSELLALFSLRSAASKNHN
ncbi:MAG: hypothetical protein K2W94_09180 [Alphaproteobacteria bacterium]|nr:hypothetical protein [Alphaproteobacteria bacterium]